MCMSVMGWRLTIIKGTVYIYIYIYIYIYVCVCVCVCLSDCLLIRLSARLMQECC